MLQLGLQFSRCYYIFSLKFSLLNKKDNMHEWANRLVFFFIQPPWSLRSSIQIFAVNQYQMLFFRHVNCWKDSKFCWLKLKKKRRVLQPCIIAVLFFLKQINFQLVYVTETGKQQSSLFVWAFNCSSKTKDKTLLSTSLFSYGEQASPMQIIKFVSLAIEKYTFCVRINYPIWYKIHIKLNTIQFKTVSSFKLCIYNIFSIWLWKCNRN